MVKALGKLWVADVCYVFLKMARYRKTGDRVDWPVCIRAIEMLWNVACTEAYKY